MTQFCQLAENGNYQSFPLLFVKNQNFPRMINGSLENTMLSAIFALFCWFLGCEGFFNLSSTRPMKRK